MSLPIRTTIEDVYGITQYLATKPTGASQTEAKSVLDSKMLDGRKIAAYKVWGLINEENGKMKLTEEGREFANNPSDVLKKVIKGIPPYNSTIERAAHRTNYVMTATNIAAHWHEHFKEQVSGNEKILKDQVVCFFHIAQAAELGSMVIGRKGTQTRIEFNEETIRDFIGSGVLVSNEGSDPIKQESSTELSKHQEDDETFDVPDVANINDGDVLEKQNETKEKNKRVFITHGSNTKILEEIKEIVGYGQREPVVAQEHETTSIPVPEKVLEEMRTCGAGIIHVAGEENLYDEERNLVPRLNGNVLIEIGAAMALYGRNLILLVEKGIELPSNLQGLYECRYVGDSLDHDATMKLLKAFNEF